MIFNNITCHILDKSHNLRFKMYEYYKINIKAGILTKIYMEVKNNQTPSK